MEAAVRQIETRNFRMDGGRLVELPLDEKRAAEASGLRPFSSCAVFLEAVDAQARKGEIDALRLPYVHAHAVTGGVWLLGGYHWLERALPALRNF